jgi:hypothetical protein
LILAKNLFNTIKHVKGRSLRIFQFVFLLATIPAIAKKETLDTADILHVNTGGGKLRSKRDCRCLAKDASVLKEIRLRIVVSWIRCKVHRKRKYDNIWFKELITALRTGVDNEGTLDKEAIHMKTYLIHID